MAPGNRICPLFTYSRVGELTASGTPITGGVANANGVAIIAPSDRNDQ
jgi:hypothetical protein